IKLLVKVAQRQSALRFDRLRTQLRLTLATLADAPVKERDRHADGGENTRMLSERRRFQRIRIETAGEVIRDLRAALGAGNADFLFGGTALRITLPQLRSLGNSGYSETIEFVNVRRRDGQISRGNRPGEIITDKDAQLVGGDEFSSARLLQLIAPRRGLQTRP